MFVIQEITGILSFIEDQDALLRRHYDEIARNKNLMTYKPNLDVYAKLEQAGVLACLVAFKDGQVVGYSFSVLEKHLHYVDLTIAHNDVLFVDQPFRKGVLGLKLIRATERVMKARGAQLMLWHAKPETNLDKILPRMGCKVRETIYCKEL